MTLKKATNIALIAILILICSTLLVFVFNSIKNGFSSNFNNNQDKDYTIVLSEYDFEPYDENDLNEQNEFDKIYDIDELMALYDLIEENESYIIPEEEYEQINLSLLPEITGLERNEDGILIGSMILEEPVLLKGVFNTINVRAQPGSDSERVATIGLGQVVEAYGVVDGWYQVNVLPGMFNGYIRSDLLIEYDENIMYLAETYVDYFYPGCAYFINKRMRCIS